MTTVPYRPKRTKTDQTATFGTTGEPEREVDAFEASRRAQSVRSTWELDGIDSRILEMQLRHPAITHREIGDILGIRRQTVTERVNAPKFKRATAIANQAARDIYLGAQAEAARKLRQLVHSEDERVALRACITLLWPIIHRPADEAHASEFARFIAEAYELAQQNKGRSSDVPPEDETDWAR
jgi:DNA-binding Lrp family transcriptional regulator